MSTMRKAVALAALSALASGARAASGRAYASTDCTGTALGSGSFTSNVCEPDDDTSSIVVCTTTASGTTYTFSQYSNADCSGTPSVTSSPTANNECANLGLFSVRINCSGCFSGSSFVVLEGDKKVHLSEVNVGDRVLSADEDGNLFFDKVFRITHWDAKDKSQIVRITAEDGSVLDLSENHYVHVNSLDADDMTLASDVSVGDSLFTVADGAVSTSAVAKVERVPAQGLFNIHTLSGRLVVNGVVSSHFTAESTWTQKSMAPYWYKAVDLVSPLFGAENAKLEA